MPRARDLGLTIGRFPPGPLNAITDVGQVAVGHVTLNEGARTRTGATAILPHPGNLFTDRPRAGITKSSSPVVNQSKASTSESRVTIGLRGSS